MENCFVTDFKGYINNNNLTELGYINFRVYENPTEQRKFTVTYNRKAAVLKAIGGDFLDAVGGNVIGTDWLVNGVKVGQTINVNSGSASRQNFFFSPTTTNILVPKYELQEFLSFVTYVDVSEFIYCEPLKTLMLYDTANIVNMADVAKFVTTQALSLTFNTINIIGTLEDVAKKTNIATLELAGSLSNQSLKGDFASWAPYRSAGTVILKTNNASKLQLKCNGVNIYELLGSAGSYTITFDGQGGVSCAVTP